jgi:hypothetical protein
MSAILLIYFIFCTISAALALKKYQHLRPLVLTRLLPIRCKSNYLDGSGTTHNIPSYPLLIHEINPSQSKRLSIKDRLGKAGQSGVLSYGILNSAYYMTATAAVWYFTRNTFITVTASRTSAALARLGKVVLTVWIGSQATKVFRLGGALMLSPVVDKVLDIVHKKFLLKSRQDAFNRVALGLWGSFFCFYSLLFASAWLATRM